MSLLKYFGKLLSSRYQDESTEEKINPESNLIATTTIINKKKISRVMYSGHPIIKIQKKTYAKRRRPMPIAESSAISSQSICGTCVDKKKRVKTYCKCCGKEMNKKVYFQEPSKAVLIDSKKCFLMLEENERLYRKRNFQHEQSDKFKHVALRDERIVKTCLKKSKAMTNIKQIEYKSFLSNKRKYSSTLSSTLQDNSQDTRKAKQPKQKIESIIESTSIGQKISSTFVVDFASTPIKLAPKTSTPVKLRKY